jgi:multidrug efflux pump subunit AcrB
MPGAPVREVEERITKPMEKLLWEIPGVEYVYSTTSPGMAMAIVRFYVGQDEEKSIVRLNQKMQANFDLIPPGASQPLIKPRSIDDVPILALTFWGKEHDSFSLRRMAAQLDDEIKSVPDVSATTLIGGLQRQVRVLIDPGKLADAGLELRQIAGILDQSNRQIQLGSFSEQNREFLVKSGGFLKDAEEVGRLVVGVRVDKPIYLKDIATIQDGPEEPRQYVFFGQGPAAAKVGDGGSNSGESTAVTISIAKRKGTNAIHIADKVLEKVSETRGRYLPADVQMTVTRHYGETAAEKSNELLFHMLLAILSVTILIALTLGWRESAVVAIAIPVTLALTLMVFYLYGYTLNRITLFALIFSIGILVDDAIVVVENIVRHARLPQNRGRALSDVAVEAVDEVGNPTILATLTVIAAILPMAFVGGLMGPYMRPIPIGASAAMVFSLLVAFIVTPWAAIRFLRGKHGDRCDLEYSGHHGEKEDWGTRQYRRIMSVLLHQPLKRYGFLALVVVLLLGSMALVYVKFVTVKMLPFDNKSEFQVIVDMPEGSTLEQTSAVTHELAGAVSTLPEVVNYQMYIGTSAPYNFNGLVRHYYLRRGPNVADIQVNLLPKGDRNAQSHDVAKRARPLLQAVAVRYGASVKVSEVPPGPPVLQTLVAEIYGPDPARRSALAQQIMNVFETTPGVVDVDWYGEEDQEEYELVVDHDKAARQGVSPQQVSENLRMALSGMGIGLLHQEREKEDIPIVLRLPVERRSSIQDLTGLRIRSASGSMLPLSELVTVRKGIADKSIFHKNLMPVVYVTGDVAGSEESPVYAIFKMNEAIDKLKIPEGYQVERFTATQPFSDAKYSMKWDGEWHITYEVFRDMGLAFAAVLVLIYILVVGWFQSFSTPLVIMAAIPFSLVGILPAHGMMGAFFTATSMIGFIAGAGIVVRNSIILVDFVELRLAQGVPLEQAVVDAGAVRFRPMMLTAAAVVVGASVILFDPIFQGLAISLMAGEIASLFLSRMTVPILYFVRGLRGIKN